MDAALLGRLFSEEKGRADWVRAMEDVLEPRQRSLLLWLSGDFEALCRFDGSACAFYLYGYEAYCAGNNTLALELLERTCRLAADEGRLAHSHERARHDRQLLQQRYAVRGHAPALRCRGAHGPYSGRR